MNNNNNPEMEQINYDDSLVSLHSVCQQYGARKVLRDFREAFPEMFAEILQQINRLPRDDLPALLR